MAQGMKEAWEAYQDSAGALSPATLSSDDSGPDEQAVDEMLSRSDAVEEAAAAHIESPDSEVRQMAALQLEAAASVDLDRANMLAAAADGEAPEATLSEDPRWELIDRILSTPTDRGISAVVRDERGLDATADDAAPTLKDIVNKAIDGIAGDSGKAAATTVKGLTGIPGADVLKVLNEGLEKKFEALGKALHWLKRKALQFVLKAVRKLLAVFGTSADAVRKRIGGWIDELDEDKVTGLLARLYQVDELKSRYGKRIDGVPGGVPADRDKAARDELGALQAKWHTRATVIEVLGGLIPHARHWIFSLAPPAGGLAYMATFTFAGGYVVFAGGDYLDWREDGGLLDLVDGVGAAVDRAVATGTPV